MAAEAHRTPEPDDQDGLFDQVIENDLLVQALENREAAKTRKRAAASKFQDAHDSAKGMIDTLDLDDETVVRCGRFRIKLSKTAARSVAFETSGSKRLTISLLD